MNLIGTGAGDLIVGSNGADWIPGYGGNDTIYGYQGGSTPGVNGRAAPTIDNSSASGTASRAAGWTGAPPDAASTRPQIAAAAAPASCW